MMNYWLGLAACALFLVAPACDCGDGGDGGGGADGGNGGDGGTTTQVNERDGIPSDDFVDILHYYISTQEDGPGLYAYRPATPDEPPVYIDPNVSLRTLFAQTLQITATEGSSSLHVRPKGVLYNAGTAFPAPLGDPVNTFVVTSDVSQLDSPPRQVSNHSTPLSTSAAYLALNDTLESSSIWFASGNMRIDLDMTPDEAPLALPESGRLIATMLGEGVRTHEHWLYVDADGTLKFYDPDFTTGTAVVDEDSGEPIENLTVAGGLVRSLGVEHLLVVLAEPDDEDGIGTMYRVTRPTGGDGGVAKALVNDSGERIELALPSPVPIGRTIPGEARSWNDQEAFYFYEGPSLFDAERPTRVIRVTANGWSATEIEMDGLAFVAGVFVRVDGGFFWAPGSEPELIYPDAGDPSGWMRTPLPDAPRALGTPVLSSAGDWVYYNTSDDAVAYNVNTNEMVILADSTWVGASLVSDIGEDIMTGLVARLPLGTALVHLEGNRLGAVEAANPQAGVVILGDLPATTETVRVSGPALGPARLVRVEHEDGAVEIVAVDTRESGSLRRIMASPAVEWSYTVMLGTSEIDVDIPPDPTAPLNFF